MEKPVFYHQQSCGMCRAVEMMLNKRGIEYDSFLITPENIREAEKAGVMGTPTLVVDGKMYVKKECIDWINSQGK